MMTAAANWFSRPCERGGTAGSLRKGDQRAWEVRHSAAFHLSETAASAPAPDAAGVQDITGRATARVVGSTTLGMARMPVG